MWGMAARHATYRGHDGGPARHARRARMPGRAAHRGSHIEVDQAVQRVADVLGREGACSTGNQNVAGSFGTRMRMHAHPGWVASRQMDMCRWASPVGASGTHPCAARASAEPGSRRTAARPSAAPAVGQGQHRCKAIDMLTCTANGCWAAAWPRPKTACSMQPPQKRLRRQAATVMRE